MQASLNFNEWYVVYCAFGLLWSFLATTRFSYIFPEDANSLAMILTILVNLILLPIALPFKFFLYIIFKREEGIEQDNIEFAIITDRVIFE